MRAGLAAVAAALTFAAAGPHGEPTAVMTAAAQNAGKAGTGSVQRREPRAGRGVRLGSFLTYLAADLGSTYVDNVFAAETNPQADLIATARSRLSVASDWGRHGVSLQAEGLATRHLRFTGENTLDYRASLDGFLDILRGTRIGVTAALSREHEDRAAPNAEGGLEPTQVDRRRVRMDAAHDTAVLGLAFAGSYETLDFADGPLPGAAEINNDDRDRSLWGLVVRVGAGRAARFRPFVQGAYDVTAYRLPRDDAGFDRDSTAVGADLGAAFDVVGIGRGEIALGYRRQDFDDPGLETMAGLTASLHLSSDLGADTRLRVTGARRLRETTVAGSPGFIETSAGLHLEHEILRHVEVDADFGFAANSFQGIDRRDDTYRLGAGLTYLYLDRAALLLRYDFTRRVSDADADFSLNRFSIGTRLRF